ncbi:MAG: peptidylprolyl isomerase [Anaerolineales bacterium]|nr:peptidylprolyl isomerase [Anaerolineales bacterium]
MQISDGKVASFHYKLTNNEGKLLDSSEGHEPLSYIHGDGMIIPGLERELTGKSEGDQFSVSIEPVDAYGEVEDNLIQTVSRDIFPSDQEVEPGMQFEARSENGIQLVTVIRVEGNQVTIDGNHPLAGERLNFDIEVTEVREATEEELAHGHVHGSDGHH